MVVRPRKEGQSEATRDQDHWRRVGVERQISYLLELPYLPGEIEVGADRYLGQGTLHMYMYEFTQMDLIDLADCRLQNAECRIN